MYNAFNVYRRELAPGFVSLTGDRAQGDDSKHWAYSMPLLLLLLLLLLLIQTSFRTLIICTIKHGNSNS